MPAVCSLCRRPEREAIDTAIVEGRDSLRNIALRYGTSAPTVLRHREHIPRQLARAAEVVEVTRADSLLERTRQLEDDSRRLLAKAEGEGDFRAAIMAVRAALDVVALLHRVNEERRESLAEDPEWTALRDRIIDALESHPAARDAVLEALRQDETAPPGFWRPREPAPLVLRWSEAKTPPEKA